MEQPGDTEALRDRLSRLSEASLRINESLDPDTVLQEVMDNARALTGARFGAITTLDDEGGLLDFITSGLSPEEREVMLALSEGPRLFEYFSSVQGPLRLRDAADHTRALGFPEGQPPVGSLMGTPMRHQGEHVGNLYVAEKEGGGEFTPEDEETLVLFASQAALVVSNARRHRDERRARTGLEALVNTSPVGVLVFDAGTGALTSINREARRIVSGLCMPGGSAEQLLEVLSFRRADGREISLGEFPLAQALSTGEAVRAEEIVIQAPDGRSVSALVNATPIRSEEGEVESPVESVVVTLQDLTPLEEMERLRAEFLGMVSHELRTPLSTIKGSATTLLEAASDLDPAEMLQFFRIINQQADYMRDLIGDLLDVARIETGTLPVAAGIVEVAVLVDEARNMFLRGGGRDNIRIELPPDLPLVTADRRRIAQVVNNLLSNAAKSSPESSAIRVSAVVADFHVAVSVADDGAGISAEHLPRLFRKFSPMEGNEGRRDLEGSGLGLAICKGIVEAHGGRIWAESDGPGLGARFTFTLPVAQEGGTGAAARPAQPSARLRQGKRKQQRVLVVDDDPQTLRYVRDALSKAGYAPVVTGDPEEVLRLIETNKPDLVLLDLMLPGTDGIELMQSILELADLPVIFLSAYGQDEVIARAFEMGASDYVVKPFSPTELAARIKAALRGRAAPARAAPSEPLVLGDLTVNYVERRVSVAGRPVHLTATEYGLLVELSLSPGRVATHDQLLRRVWGGGHSGDARLVRGVVKRLRRKLGDDGNNPTYIFTEPRVGYRMAQEETQGPEESME